MPPPATSSGAAGAWFTVWSRPQNVALSSAADPLDGGRGPGPLLDQSNRDIVQASGSGDQLRIRLTNRYGATYSPNGTRPLTVLAATAARRSRGAAVHATTVHDLSWRGSRQVTIPAGGTVLSDPVDLPVRAGQDLAISLHVQDAPVAGARRLLRHLLRRPRSKRRPDT